MYVYVCVCVCVYVCVYVYVCVCVLILKHNTLFSHWLWSRSFADRQRYLSQKRFVARAVRSSKNKWIQEKAQSIQDALAQGRSSVVWRDIRAIHECRAGIQPVHFSAIKKKDGGVHWA